MPPTQPGDYHNDPWPCRIKADFKPTTHVGDRLAVTKDEEGVVWQWQNQQCYLEIDRSKPQRIGWVPDGFIEVSILGSFHILFSSCPKHSNMS